MVTRPGWCGKSVAHFCGRGSQLTCLVLLLGLVFMFGPAAGEEGRKREESIENTLKHLSEEQDALMAEQGVLLKQVGKVGRVSEEDGQASSEAPEPQQDDGGQQCRREAKAEEQDEDDDGFPFVSLTVLLVGCGYLLRLCYVEYLYYTTKILSSDSEHRDEAVSISEFLQYRLDFYFSSTQWAKPLLLLGVTFILILFSSTTMILILGDNLAGAMWKAWTYVADPGKVFCPLLSPHLGPN